MPISVGPSHESTTLRPPGGEPKDGNSSSEKQSDTQVGIEQVLEAIYQQSMWTQKLLETMYMEKYNAKASGSNICEWGYIENTYRQ